MDTFDTVIFYTNYDKDDIGEEGKFYNQANHYKEKEEQRGANVLMIQVDTVEEFVKMWNGLQGRFNTVYVFSHGNGMSLIFQGGNGISATGYNKKGNPITPISALKSKKIGSLYLMSCNSGHRDLYKFQHINVAAAFRSNGGIGIIYAFDGSMSYDSSFDARKSFNQRGFFGIYNDYDLGSAVFPRGWICY